KVVFAATDFSDASLKATQHAAEVAQLANAELHLLHVVDAGDFPEGEGSPLSPRSALEQKITAEANKRLDAARELISSRNLTIRTHLAWGTPWQQIVATAESLSADLIVLGTIGRTGLQGLLVGNTAERVLDHSPCGVLTVKPDGYVSPVDPSSRPQS
ncbi:MAG TPA: universal stress protein, partial [Planctomycetaceae bacterium]|nr:universal stress protein [Planctomycetaceae bacterium]